MFALPHLALPVRLLLLDAAEGVVTRESREGGEGSREGVGSGKWCMTNELSSA